MARAPLEEPQGLVFAPGLVGVERRAWEHSIPPAKELRYPITRRTLK